MNRLMLGAAAIALGVGTMGIAQAQTAATGQQNLQPASCTQLDVGEVANRVGELQDGTRKEQLQQLIVRARDASTSGNVMQCRQLLVEAEAMLPGGAQTTKTTPAPAFLGGPDSQSSSTARSANPEQAPIQADNVVAALRNNPQFSTLVSLIETAGMTDALSGSGQHTVFAPTNAAFNKLPQNVRDQLGQEQHRDQLRAILAQHVVEGQSLASTQLPQDIKAMGGNPIDVSLTNGRPRLTIGEPQPQSQSQAQSQQQTRNASSTSAAPNPAPTPSASNQALTDALSAVENAKQALAGDNPDSQRASDQLTRARQAIDRGQNQTSESQSLQQASSAIGNATQALQNNDPAAARTAVDNALQPLRQAEAATPSSANQTNQQATSQQTGNQQQAMASSPAQITVGDIRTGNGFVHGIDTVLIPEGVQEALAQ
jgi:uncharacterized surface protein with fasciclin (FAS1) repeats